MADCLFSYNFALFFPLYTGKRLSYDSYWYIQGTGSKNKTFDNEEQKKGMISFLLNLIILFIQYFLFILVLMTGLLLSSEKLNFLN